MTAAFQQAFPIGRSLQPPQTVMLAVGLSLVSGFPCGGGRGGQGSGRVGVRGNRLVCFQRAAFVSCGACRVSADTLRLISQWLFRGAVRIRLCLRGWLDRNL